MGSPGRFARGSLEDDFTRASSTLGLLGTEARSFSRFQTYASFKGGGKAATTKFDNQAGVSATRCCFGCSSQEGGEARSSAHHVGTGRRDVPHHPGSVAESTNPGSRAAGVRTHQVHEVVSGEEAETSRGGTPSHSEGHRSSGRVCCRTGEGRRVVGRWATEVGRVGSGRESHSISICATTTSWARGFFRAESHAGHHRQSSTRVGKVARGRNFEPCYRRRRVNGGGSPTQQVEGWTHNTTRTPTTPLAITGGHASTLLRSPETHGTV